MLKLTEAELAEMGFGQYWGFTLHRTAPVRYEHGEFRVGSGVLTRIYPQTKEDLLTLIRLFEPPQEVKDV